MAAGAAARAAGVVRGVAVLAAAVQLRPRSLAGVHVRDVQRPVASLGNLNIKCRGIMALCLQILYGGFDGFIILDTWRDTQISEENC